MEIKNKYWKDKQEKYEKENVININSNNGKKTRTMIGIILISAVAIIGFIDSIIQNEKKERIRKINEEITKYNQQIYNNYKENTNIYSSKNTNTNINTKINENEEKINVYERFEGRILSYTTKNNEIFAEVWRWDKNRDETIKTLGNNIQDLEYKIKNNNSFTFTCKTKRKFYLEDCEIY